MTEHVDRGSCGGFVASVAYLIATVSAFLNERLSLAICTLLWIFWAATITKNTRA
jgi:hypothetical protein